VCQQVAVLKGRLPISDENLTGIRPILSGISRGKWQTSFRAMYAFKFAVRGLSSTAMANAVRAHRHCQDRPLCQSPETCDCRSAPRPAWPRGPWTCAEQISPLAILGDADGSDAGVQRPDERVMTWHRVLLATFLASRHSAVGDAGQPDGTLCCGKLRLYGLPRFASDNHPSRKQTRLA
jgi:hypothetical protein